MKVRADSMLRNKITLVVEVRTRPKARDAGLAGKRPRALRGRFLLARGPRKVETGFRTGPRANAKTERVLRTEEDGDENEQGNDRRRNGDRSARRPGRAAPLRLSGRRGAADLRRDLRAEGQQSESAARSRAPRAGRRARGRR